MQKTRPNKTLPKAPSNNKASVKRKQATVAKKVRRQEQRLVVRANPFKNNPFSFTDVETVCGFQSLTQSLFSGNAGCHRGIAFGAQTTALCRFRQAFDVNIPAGTNLTFAWAPSTIASPNTFSYSQPGATSTGLYTDPFNSNGALGFTTGAQAGPFYATLPALAYRIVRAAIRIIPSAAVLNQGGLQTYAYVPVAYLGQPTAANLAGIPSVTNGGVWSATNFENFEFFKSFTGTQQTILQWFPNDDEIYIQNSAYYNGTNPTPLSGFYALITAPATAAITYRFEIDYGIEYVPNLAYRPYVDRQLPMTHPNAEYELNKFITLNWDGVVIATVGQHDINTASIDHVKGGLTKSYQMSNQAGIPSQFLPVLEEETAENGDGLLAGMGEMAKNVGSELLTHLVTTGLSML